MARGRFLSKQIARNEILAELGARHALLFTWMLPHLDRDGRMRGHPKLVRSEVVPLLDFTDEEVEAMLIDFDRRMPDFHYYEDEHGTRYLQYDNFKLHQVGFNPGDKNYEREPPSKCPGPSECHAVKRTHLRALPEMKVVGPEEEPW